MTETATRDPTDHSDLPDPLGPVIRKALADDMERILAKCETPEQAQTEAMHIIAIWTCRAARVYASVLVERLREANDGEHQQLVGEIEALQRQNDSLRGQIDLVGQNVELLRGELLLAKQRARN